MVILHMSCHYELHILYFLNLEVAGDKWCLCILRWIEAHKAGKAPKIIPESTNELALKYVSKNILMKYIY